MNQNKIKEILEDYKKCLSKLREVLNEDLSKGGFVIDAAIQRFEFTFELAWKLLRAILLYRGIETNSPRSAIKEAYREKLIIDGDSWIEMLEDRNKTSHTYDENEAKVIYTKIKNVHLNLFNSLETSVKI